jgi:hypothetical protein
VRHDILSVRGGMKHSQDGVVDSETESAVHWITLRP